MPEKDSLKITPPAARENVFRMDGGKSHLQLFKGAFPLEDLRGYVWRLKSESQAKNMREGTKRSQVAHAQIGLKLNDRNLTEHTYWGVSPNLPGEYAPSFAHLPSSTALGLAFR